MELENQISPEEKAPIQEETTQLSCSVITREHKHIGKDFLDRVAYILRQPTKIKNYAVEENSGKYSPATEAITLEVDGKHSLSIRFITYMNE